jgi:PAS domain S-box-containing protein
MPRPALPDQRKALLKSEDSFRTLVEKSTDAIQLLDENGQVIFSGKSVERLLGYKASELKGASAGKYVHPDDLQKFTKTFSHLLKKPGGKAHLEYRVRHKSGKWIWLEAIGVNYLQDPAIHALVGDFRDITKRKEVEQALAESEARLRFMAESMPQKIFTVNSEGLPDYFNPQWREYAGPDFEGVTPENLGSLLHPDDTERTVRIWRHALKTGHPMIVEHRFHRIDGTYRWHLTRMRPRHDKDGNIIMWIGSSTDIEAVKIAQKRQQQAEQRVSLLAEERRQLLKLNKAKDEFISLASHQLRTPATGVKQYLAMILEGYADVEVPPQILRMVQTAYESNERQLKIVDDLLRVANVDAGKLKLRKENVDIIKLLKEVVKEQSVIFASRNQILVHDRHCRAKQINADMTLIRMVLDIILDNASQYSAEGKTIRVTERCTKKYISIIVSDEGVGISNDDQRKLFKKFSRIDNEYSTQVGGSGLGLYWAQQVVELHSGSIKVSSEVDKGSTFTVKIPLSRSVTD